MQFTCNQKIHLKDSLDIAWQIGNRNKQLRKDKSMYYGVYSHIIIMEVMAHNINQWLSAISSVGTAEQVK